MIYLQLRKGFYDDIDLADIWVGGGIALLCVIVVYAILFGLAALITASSNSSDEKFNTEAAIYNDLAPEIRIILYEYTDDYPDADPETHLIEPREITPFLEDVKNTSHWFWLAAFGLALIIASIVMAECYRESKYRRYYFAEFPLRTPLEVLTFCAMFAATPFFLVSLIRMLPQKLNLIDSEKREVERLAKIESRKSESWQMLPPKVARCTPADIKRYCEIRVNRAQQFRTHTIEKAEQRVRSCQEELNSLGLSVRNAQRKLNEAKAELNTLQSTPSKSATLEQAKTELQTIREMRGVSSVTANKSIVKNGAILSFDVKVRVPYQDELYDFGDYRITFFQKDFRCKHLRSGVRKDATSTSPDYSTGDGFCFGDRRYTIIDYVSSGRLVEAATLIVDSLHSVNNERVEREIPKCFRKVRVIQKRAAIIRRDRQKAR